MKENTCNTRNCILNVDGHECSWANCVNCEYREMYSDCQGNMVGTKLYNSNKQVCMTMLNKGKFNQHDADILTLGSHIARTMQPSVFSDDFYTELAHKFCSYVNATSNDFR